MELDKLVNDTDVHNFNRPSRPTPCPAA